MHVDRERRNKIVPLFQKDEAELTSMEVGNNLATPAMMEEEQLFPLSPHSSSSEDELGTSCPPLAT